MPERWRLWSALSVTGFLSLAACTDGGGGGGGEIPPDPDGGSDAGLPDGGDGLALASVMPGEGPVAGGTLITLAGEGFDTQLKVVVGGREAVGVVVSDPSTATARTPMSDTPGAVTVRVENPDGSTSRLTGAFTYLEGDEPPVGEPVDWCNLQFPHELSGAPGASLGPVFGRVFVEGVTDSEGAGAGVEGEVGFGPVGSNPERAEDLAGWTWGAAAFFEDRDTANDEFSASFDAPADGNYHYAYRFRRAANAPWTYCDSNGSDDGYDPAFAGRLTVSDVPMQSPGWCRVEGPASLRVDPGGDAGPFTALVFIDGVTTGAGQGAGVEMLVAYGPTGSTPEDPVWVTAPASYREDADGLVPGDLANDRYAATLTSLAEGLYDVAFLLETGGQQIWCDLSSSDDGYDGADAAKLRVGALPPPEVSWCNTQFPDALSGELGQDVGPVFGRVWVEGATEGEGPGAGISGELGVGPDGSDPALDAGWSWVPGDFFGDRENNDEHSALLRVPAVEGSYDYAWRFRIDDGPWTYCDLGGSDDGYDAAQAGALVASAPPPPDPVEWCQLEGAARVSVDADAATDFFAQIFHGGLTPGAGEGAGLEVEFLHAPVSAGDPREDDSWVSAAASYEGDVDGANEGDLSNDRYRFTVEAFGTAGDRRGVFRARQQGGEVWTWCDRDGAGNGFQLEQTVSIEVTGGDDPLAIARLAPSAGPSRGGFDLAIFGPGVDGATAVRVGDQDCPISEAVSEPEPQVTCQVPAGPLGSVSVVVTADRMASGPRSFEYLAIGTPDMDGIIGDDWHESLRVAVNTVTSAWDPELNRLDALWLATDALNVYIGVEGIVEANNAILFYVDVNYGEGQGLAQMSSISDNDGALDAALSNALDVSDAGFGAELAGGTVGMNAAIGELVDNAGWRRLGPLDNLPWAAGELIAGEAGFEAAIPRDVLFPDGVPAEGAELGVFARISNAAGTDFANQALPEGVDDAEPARVSNIAHIRLTP